MTPIDNRPDDVRKLEDAYGKLMHRYVERGKELKELKAELADERRQLEPQALKIIEVNNELRQLRAELAEARRDAARARWYFDQKNSSIVGGLELKWLQQLDCLTYEQWAQDIDAAMTEAK